MTLTPQDCKEARRKLGLSAEKMARAVGLSDGRAVRRFEADHGSSTGRTPQGPLECIYRLILAGRVDKDDLEAVAPKAP